MVQPKQNDAVDRKRKPSVGANALAEYFCYVEVK